MRAELLRLAGYQCAICHRRLHKFDKVSGKTKDIADAAHMYPHSDRGERGDPARRPALVDDISNLIMLCPNCHRLVDWDGVGGRLFTVDTLRAIRREQEAWVEFKESRPGLVAADQPGLSCVRRGQSVSVRGQTYRLPWDERPGRVDTTFFEEWAPERDAVRCRSYAYAETGAVRHAWLRQIDALDDSETGERWRCELADEASLLKAQLPQLPGLPSVLGINALANGPFALVTALPSTISLLNRYGIAGDPGRTDASVMAEESVRALFAGLPALCAALDALHDAGLAHGALDPRAILVGQRGDLVLRDLGHATAEPTASTDASAGKPDERTTDDDVHRLAAIVYELVTGVRPLTGEGGPPVPASAYNPAVSDQAATALTAALTGGIRDARALARFLHAPRPHTSRPRSTRAGDPIGPREEPRKR
jgi:hypothetical protein